MAEEGNLITSTDLQNNGISVIIKGIGPGITFENREMFI